MLTFDKSIDFSWEKREQSKIDLDYSWEVWEIVNNSSQKAWVFDALSKKESKDLGFWYVVGLSSDFCEGHFLKVRLLRSRMLTLVNNRMKLIGSEIKPLNSVW